MNAAKVQFISPDKIISNAENAGMSVEGIEELQASIEDIGLKQFPLLILQPGGKYRIIAGHGRIEAIRRSIESGNSRYQEGIPCIIENLALIDLPIPDEMKKVHFGHNQHRSA